MLTGKFDKPLLISCIALSFMVHLMGIFSLHLSEIQTHRRFTPLFENRKPLTANSSSSKQPSATYTQELETVLQSLVMQSRQGRYLQNPISAGEGFEARAMRSTDKIAKGIDNQKEKDFAQSPHASLKDGHSKRASQAKGQLVQGELSSTTLNDFDTTYKKLQLGLRDPSLPKQVENPSLAAQGDSKKRSRPSVFNLAVPSEKERFSRNLIYNQETTVEAPERSGHDSGLSTSQSMASQDDFSVQLRSTPKAQGGGYIFELSMLPKKEASFKRLNQNLYFLIDRSSSLSKSKFEAYKMAVSQALDSLHPQDHFNILFFDQNINRLSSNMLKVSPENLKKARAFIKTQQHGDFFASTDLYDSLNKLLPKHPPEDEVNMAMLLTDGNSHLSLKEQRQALYAWTQKNQRKLSLFTFTCGNKNKLPELELLSTFNKGQLYHSPSPDQLASKLQKFIISKKSPLGKDIIVHAVSQNPKTRLQLFPKEGRLLDLYEGTPYILYGEINQEDDFVVFLQGKHGGKWVNIKQKVSFNQGQDQSPQVTDNLVYHQALDYYEKYLKEGILSDLRQANYLLNTINRS